MAVQPLKSQYNMDPFALYAPLFRADLGQSHPLDYALVPPNGALTPYIDPTWNVPVTHYGLHEYLRETTVVESRAYINRIISDTDLWILDILPRKKTTSTEIKMNETIWEGGVWMHTPEEAVSDMISVTRSERSETIVRRGKGLMMQSEALKTPGGRADYRMGVQTLLESFLDTACFDILLSLYLCKDTERSWIFASGYFPTMEMMAYLEHDRDMTFIAQKNGLLGWKFMEAVASDMAKAQKINPTMWILPQRMASILAFSDPAQTEYWRVGPQAGQLANAAGNMKSGDAFIMSQYSQRVVRLLNIKSADPNNLQYDPMVRQRQIGEYEVMTPIEKRFPSCIHKYTSAWRNIVIFEQSKNDFTEISMEDAIRYCSIFKNDPLVGFRAPQNNGSDGYMTSRSRRNRGGGRYSGFGGGIDDDDDDDNGDNNDSLNILAGGRTNKNQSIDDGTGIMDFPTSGMGDTNLEEHHKNKCFLYHYLDDGTGKMNMVPLKLFGEMSQKIFKTENQLLLGKTMINLLTCNKAKQEKICSEVSGYFSDLKSNTNNILTTLEEAIRDDGTIINNYLFETHVDDDNRFLPFKDQTHVFWDENVTIEGVGGPLGQYVVGLPTPEVFNKIAEKINLVYPNHPLMNDRFTMPHRKFLSKTDVLLDNAGVKTLALWVRRSLSQENPNAGVANYLSNVVGFDEELKQLLPLDTLNYKRASNGEYEEILPTGEYTSANSYFINQHDGGLAYNTRENGVFNPNTLIGSIDLAKINSATASTALVTRMLNSNPKLIASNVFLIGNGLYYNKTYHLLWKLFIKIWKALLRDRLEQIRAELRGSDFTEEIVEDIKKGVYDSIHAKNQEYGLQLTAGTTIAGLLELFKDFIVEISELTVNKTVTKTQLDNTLKKVGPEPTVINSYFTTSTKADRVGLKVVMQKSAPQYSWVRTNSGVTLPMMVGYLQKRLADRGLNQSEILLSFSRADNPDICYQTNELIDLNNRIQKLQTERNLPVDVGPLAVYSDRVDNPFKFLPTILGLRLITDPTWRDGIAINNNVSRVNNIRRTNQGDDGDDDEMDINGDDIIFSNIRALDEHAEMYKLNRSLLINLFALSKSAIGEELEKIMVRAYLYGQFSRNNLLSMNRNNIVIPLQMIIVAPHMTYDALGGILLEPGDQTGNFYYMEPDYRINEDGAKKVFYTHLTIMCKAVVRKPENIMIFSDLASIKALSGGTTIFYTTDTYNIQNNDKERDYDPSIKQSLLSLVIGYNENLERVIDISGLNNYFRCPANRIVDGNNTESLNYSTAALYNLIFRFRRRNDISRYSIFNDEIRKSQYCDGQTAPLYNTICWAGHTQRYNPTSKHFDDIERNTSPWGPNIGPGSAQIRNGMPAITKGMLPQ